MKEYYTKFVPMNWKKLKSLYPHAICALIPLIIFGCSAVPVDDRFEKAVQKSERSNSKFFEDEVNLSPYFVEFDKIDKPVKQDLTKNNNDIWFNYKSDATSKLEQVKTNGFRVQIISTTELEEADSVRAELYFKTNQKNIYLIFEPPYYKVRIGDYISQTNAQELAFKLNQLGIKNPVVVPDSVLIRK